MKIKLVLSVPDPEDEDNKSTTGLTQEAYDRLVDAVTDAGFEFESGPHWIDD